jgi:HAMP domain-containing protein
MRRLGQLLAALGLVVGGVLGLAMSVPLHLAGISWLIAVGLAKLTFAAALGLIAGGAVLQRIGRRSEERTRLSAPPGASGP